MYSKEYTQGYNDAYHDHIVRGYRRLLGSQYTDDYKRGYRLAWSRYAS